MKPGRAASDRLRAENERLRSAIRWVMTDWNEVMAGYGGARPDDNDLVQITRGTARLARAALHAQNETDYYHNYGAAERELLTALGELCVRRG
jgi:hypothetical protein